MDSEAAYLFDIGNVIIRFDFQIAARRIEHQCAIDSGAILSVIEPLAEPFERGELSVEEFVSAATERTGFSGTDDEFVRAFAEIFSLNQPIADLIRELDAAGHSLFLLSNTNAIHEPYFTREWADLFGRFRGAVFSHQAGHMKPDREIFEIAIEQLELEPARTFYIDDRPENVAAGASFGFQAIQYDPDHHQALLEAIRPC